MSKNTTKRNSAAKKRKSADRKSPTSSKAPGGNKQAERKPLTHEQAELLTESFLNGCCREAAVVNPLLVILDDLHKNCRDSTQVENVAFAVMRRCYAGTSDADDREDEYIERIREQFSKAEKEKN